MIHLPIKNTKSVILGEKYKDILDIPLKKLDITPVYLPINKNIEWQINSHIDINLIQINKDITICEPSIKADFDVIYGDTFLKEGYPNNIAYNGLLIGKKFFHNLKYSDKKILTLLEKDVSLHNVSQGFSKCMVCILNEQAVITSDAGMYDVLSKNIKNVLLIKQGFIDLEGYDYGFIGGASFKYNAETICFTGKFENHPNYNDILEFVAQENIQIYYLTNKNLFDVGSILPIF